MTNQGGSPPRKGPRWIVDQIAAAFEASTGEPAPTGRRLSRSEVDQLVAEALEEELGRVGREKDIKDVKDPKD